MSTLTTLLLIVPLMHTDAMAFKHLLYIRLSCSIIHNFLSIYLSFLLFARLPLFVCLFFCNIWTVQKKNIVVCTNLLKSIISGRAKPHKMVFVCCQQIVWVGLTVLWDWRLKGWGFPYDMNLKNLNIKTLTAFENRVREIA